MKKIFALALVAVFCLAGYGVSAQTQSKNQKLSPKQEKREAREQRRAQRQAEYERYIDSLGRRIRYFPALRQGCGDAVLSDGTQLHDFQSRGDPQGAEPQRLGGHFRHFALLCDQVCLYAGYLCQDRRCDADHHQFLEHYGAVFGYDHFAVTAVFG